MDPAKGHGDYSHYASSFKGQGRMPNLYGEQGYGLEDQGLQNNYMGADAGFMNPAMAYGGAMNMNGLENMIPPNDQNMNYYQEYCRLFIANVVLTTQMKELIAEKNELLNRLNELERGEKVSKQPTLSDAGLEKKSRLRRKAVEIERHYKCPSGNCGKTYGSEGSLIQHIKLKHPEVTEDPDWKVKIVGSGEGGEDEEKDDS